MTSVHITWPQDSTQRRAYRALFGTAISVLFLALFDRWFFGRPLSLIDAAAFGIFFSIWSFWSDTPRPAFDLEIDDDQIRLLRQGSVKQVVSKAQIHYVRERGGNFLRPPSILISQRGALGTFFLGGITVPKSSPDYEQIKRQALSWLEAAKA
jgi:hypothetical protein